MEHLPFDGEFAEPQAKKFQEVVVFVHHFGGSKRTVERHSRMMNSLGFTTARFSFTYNQALPSKSLPITADLKFGARHLWADQIEFFLNAIPGKKILYSFSMPSNATLAAIARRQAKDIAAWICDGGPFVDLPTCIWNLYENQYKIPSRIVKGIYTAASLAIFGARFPSDVPRYFAEIPPGFPILSIRSSMDALVPLSAIDGVFKEQRHINLESVVLEDVGHLDGLKLKEKAYTKLISNFARRIATPV